MTKEKAKAELWTENVYVKITNEESFEYAKYLLKKVGKKLGEND